MHAIRIDEIMLQRGGVGLIRVFNPTQSAHEEAVLGRPFGFICFDMPRSPQIESIASDVEAVIEDAYSNGTLRPGQTPEMFFEEVTARVRETVAAKIKEQRIKIDASLLTILLGAVAGSDIFFTRHNHAEAYLVRRVEGSPAKTADIFRGLDETSSERLLNDLVVGAITPDDLVLVASGSLFEAFPIADIVEAVNQTEPAAVASRIRSLILAGTENRAVVGCLVRLSPVRAMFRAKENSSVSALRSNEEEVARTLSPSGIPAFGAFLDKFKAKEKPTADSRRTVNREPRRNEPKKSPIEHFNSLPHVSKLALAALVVVIAILAVSLKLIAANNRHIADDKAFAAQIEAVKKQITDAESTQIYDETKARLILNLAEASLQKLPNTNKAQNAAREELASAIANADRRLKHLYDVSPKILETVNGPIAFVLKLPNGYLANAGANLLLIGSNGSPTSIATLPDEPVWAAATGNTAGDVYIWLKNGTLISLGTIGKSIPKPLDYGGPANPRAGAVWNGNLYTLSSDGKQLWKLPPTLTGFGRGVSWLASPLAGNGASTIIIDGSVYIPVPGDAIRKFEHGKMTAFAASGASANAVPISIELGNAGNIYLLGSDNSLAVWDKTGKLLAQYNIPATSGKPSAFTVDETANTITVATDKNIIVNFTPSK